MFLISPEELAWKNLEAEHQEITEEDYKVNIKNLEEEQRVVSGIHDVYGRLFHELGGGKAELGQGSGKDKNKLSESIAIVKNLLSKMPD